MTDGDTFILKKVILVRRSTVDLRSCSLSGLLAGKLFCSKTERQIYSERQHNTSVLAQFVSVSMIKPGNTISTVTSNTCYGVGVFPEYKVLSL